MIVIPAGSFVMGSPPDEPGHTFAEAPRHRVRIARFALGRTEVTFAQWDACAAAGGCARYRPSDHGWGRGTHPAIDVSLFDALRYARWLSARTGRTYRLPTEAEWEYAARAGTRTAYWTGATMSTADASFASSRTRRVATFAPNAFGVHDTSGNVAEWTADCIHYDYRGAPADGRAWTDGNCAEHVVRGGSWASDARLVRSAMRFGLDARDRSWFVGFRIAASL